MNSLGHVVLVLVVYTLAIARLTRLINFDTILDPTRIAIARIFGPNSTAVYFAACPWCVSVWVSAATAWVPLFFADNRVVQYFGIVLAASHLVGVGARWSSDEELDIETVEEG